MSSPSGTTGSSGILRRFTAAGIAEFVRRIETLRSGGQAEIDDGLVTDPELTESIVPEVPLQRPAFKTKRDAGAYLSERTRAARAVLGDDDRGLWTWLSAWHWDAVCPVREGGRRKVLGPYHYVYGHGFHRLRQQHLFAVSTMLFEVAAGNHLLLETPVNSLTKVVQTVSTRLGLLRNKGVVDLLDSLYWDRANHCAKPGVADPRVVRPGDLGTRLPNRLRQLEVTHDLTNLTAEQLLNLLGDEFRQWAVAPTTPHAATRRHAPRATAAPPPPTPSGQS